MIIVVEGCGQWAMRYLQALVKVLQENKRIDVGVFFTYDLEFGRENVASELHEKSKCATRKNVKRIQDAGFPCLNMDELEILPHNVDAVFIVTPDSTHCDRAEYWFGRARKVFVEKPFDASTARIRQFCDQLGEQEYTQVFAVDHYLIRFDPVVVLRPDILDYLLAGDLTQDITEFEFCMTEPPELDKEGGYTNEKVGVRAAALQGGMVFDMGSHALPVLLPFIDIEQPISIINVWAGVSEGLRLLIPNAETASIVEVAGYTNYLGNSSQGRLIVGKDITDAEKYLKITGPGGSVRFDLGTDEVRFEPPREAAPLFLETKWTEFFIRDVLDGGAPPSVRMFRPDGALTVIKFLEQWRDRCQAGQAGSRKFPGYAEQGTTVVALQTQPFEC